MKDKWVIDFYWNVDKLKAFEKRVEENKKKLKEKKKLEKKNEKNME